MSEDPEKVILNWCGEFPVPKWQEKDSAKTCTNCQASSLQRFISLLFKKKKCLFPLFCFPCFASPLSGQGKIVHGSQLPPLW